MQYEKPFAALKQYMLKNKDIYKLTPIQVTNDT